MTELFTPDFRSQPYWWDRAAPMPIAVAAPPREVDVAVVGTGFTALSAALVLLRAGRNVALLDSEDPGFGASRRNAGYLGRTLKKSFPDLMATHGREHALAVYRELDAALQTVRAVIAEERIECHEVRCGRFIGATSPAHYARMAREFEVTRQHLGFEYHMLSRAEQRMEIATDLYCGGAVIPDLGALHPGLYHKGLLECVLAAGGIVCGRTEVRGIVREPHRMRLEIGAGSIMARDVIVATNGYTPRHFPWHARRLIPFTAYMAATEKLARDAARDAAAEPANGDRFQRQHRFRPCRTRQSASALRRCHGKQSHVDGGNRAPPARHPRSHPARCRRGPPQSYLDRPLRRHVRSHAAHGMP